VSRVLEQVLFNAVFERLRERAAEVASRCRVCGRRGARWRSRSGDTDVVLAADRREPNRVLLTALLTIRHSGWWDDFWSWQDERDEKRFQRRRLSPLFQRAEMA